MGQSSSSKQQNKNGTIDQHSIINDAKDFMELMDELKIDKFMLGGWSAGAQYALAIATLNPQRISKLGLFVPVSMYYGNVHHFQQRFKQKFDTFGC